MFTWRENLRYIQVSNEDYDKLTLEMKELKDKLQDVFLFDVWVPNFVRNCGNVS